MAVSITTNYTGDVYPNILTQMLSENTIVAGGHIFVQPVVDKFYIPYMDLDNAIQKRKAELDIVNDPVGTVSHTEKVLQPEELMVFMKFNPRSYESYWKKYQPKGQLLFKELPSDIQTKILRKLTNQVSHKLGYLAVNGDSSDAVSTYMGMNVDYFDGYLKRFKDSIGTSEAVTHIGQDEGAVQAIDVSNVEDALQKVKDAIMSTNKIRWTYNEPGFKYFMSVVDADKWSQAQRTASFKGAAMTEAGLLRFDGKPIVALEGIPEGVMFATVGTTNESSNLWAGVNDQRDDDSILVDRTAPFNETYFVKMLLDMGTQVRQLDEVVLYDWNINTDGV